MKVAVVGHGKTGTAVTKVLLSSEIQDIFNSKNIVSVEALRQADIAIVFVSH